MVCLGSEINDQAFPNSQPPHPLLQAMSLLLDAKWAGSIGKTG